jgi:XTP/dITP diphosphohydrolase
MRRRVIVASRSSHKANEIRELLSAACVDFVSLLDAGIAPSPEENELERFETFVENARAKARHFHTRTGLPTIADDSGLRVDALEGGPGVRTKRFAPDELVARYGLDEANNRYLLDRLSGIAEDERGAHYHCAMVAVDERGESVAEGTVYGRIALHPSGSGGFGYDPLFVLPTYGRTYAELPPGVKRATSHRARAARQLIPWLDSLDDS